ncbi:hypothetical protein AMTR_s00034p00078330, partial [Amborella trichopoda]
MLQRFYSKKHYKFIKNHSFVLYLVRKLDGKKLVRPKTTRFLTNFVTLQSILQQKDVLGAMVNSSVWVDFIWVRKSSGR